MEGQQRTLTRNSKFVEATTPSTTRAVDESVRVSVLFLVAAAFVVFPKSVSDTNDPTLGQGPSVKVVIMLCT